MNSDPARSLLERGRMLVAGCAGCRRVVPLFCAGQFFPHMPLNAVQTPMGVGCLICGMVPPVFTCTTCFTTQQLFLPNTPFSLAAVQAQGVKVAPVAQIAEGTGANEATSVLQTAAKSFANQFGKSAAEQLIAAFAGGGQ